MKHRPLAKKVVTSNGRARHVMYVNAEEKSDAYKYVSENNVLLSERLRSGGWHISYIL